MAYLRTFTGEYLLRIENDYIKDYSSGMIKYRINGDRVCDYGGRTLFQLDGDKIKDYLGRILLYVDYQRIKQFGGHIIATYDNNYIKEFSGKIIYKFDGFLSKREVMALMAIIFAS